MNDTERWEVNALNQIPALCAEVKRLSEENGRLKDTLREKLEREQGYILCPVCGNPMTLKTAMPGEEV